MFIDGEKQEPDIDIVIDNYVQQINQALNFDYNIPVIKNIYLAGGGGEYLYSYIKKSIPRIELMENPQFTNALSYQILGEALFDEGLLQ